MFNPKFKFKNDFKKFKNKIHFVRKIVLFLPNVPTHFEYEDKISHIKNGITKKIESKSTTSFSYVYAFS